MKQDFQKDAGALDFAMSDLDTAKINFREKKVAVQRDTTQSRAEQAYFRAKQQ